MQSSAVLLSEVQPMAADKTPHTLNSFVLPVYAESVWFPSLYEKMQAIVWTLINQTRLATVLTVLF